MTLDPTFISSLTLIATAFGAAFVVVLWLSLVIWAYRDIRSRTRDQLVRILAALVVAVLFLPGLVIYIILRPAHTLEEEYQHTLEEEALLTSIEDSPLCPGCSRQIKEDWVACPSCHTRLRKPCQHCNRLMELSWNLCPYCGTAVSGSRQDGETSAEPIERIEIQSFDAEGLSDSPEDSSLDETI